MRLASIPLDTGGATIRVSSLLSTSLCREHHAVWTAGLLDEDRPGLRLLQHQPKAVLGFGRRDIR